MSIGFAITPEEELRWFLFFQGQERKHKEAIESGDIWALRISAEQLCTCPNVPEFIARGKENDYRRGFRYGWVEATRLVFELYRSKGFVRPNEIGNILAEHQHILHRWQNEALSEDPLRTHGEPLPNWRSWYEIRRDILKRDEFKCTECDATENLEIHHLTPVADGGLPTAENLVTLCFKCHRGEGGGAL